MNIYKNSINWIKRNKVGLYIGGVTGFMASRILFSPDNGGGRQALAELSRAVGPIDSLLSGYAPNMIVFIKITIVLIIFFALIGGFVDEVID